MRPAGAARGPGRWGMIRVVGGERLTGLHSSGRQWEGETAGETEPPTGGLGPLSAGGSRIHRSWSRFARLGESIRVTALLEAWWWWRWGGGRAGGGARLCRGSGSASRIPGRREENMSRALG